MAYTHIATLNEEGICNGLWSGDWNGERELKDNEIIVENSSVMGKRYVNGEWVEVPQPEPLPTDEEIMQAEVLLNQTEILAKQNEQDMVLAEILLNQMGG